MGAPGNAAEKRPPHPPLKKSNMCILQYVSLSLHLISPKVRKFEGS